MASFLPVRGKLLTRFAYMKYHGSIYAMKEYSVVMKSSFGQTNLVAVMGRSWLCLQGIFKCEIGNVNPV